MSRFEALISCIRSGQLSDGQIAAELRDAVFAAFYRQRIETDHRPRATAPGELK